MYLYLYTTRYIHSFFFSHLDCEFVKNLFFKSAAPCLQTPESLRMFKRVTAGCINLIYMLTKCIECRFLNVGFYPRFKMGRCLVLPVFIFADIIIFSNFSMPFISNIICYCGFWFPMTIEKHKNKIKKNLHLPQKQIQSTGTALLLLQKKKNLLVLKY